jgi:hypothetical protein
MSGATPIRPGVEPADPLPPREVLEERLSNHAHTLWRAQAVIETVRGILDDATSGLDNNEVQRLWMVLETAERDVGAVACAIAEGAVILRPAEVRT